MQNQVQNQIIVRGRLKSGPNADTVTFKLRLAMFELTCIVTVPNEGTIHAPVYVHFGIVDQQQQALDNSGEYERFDRQERRPLRNVG